MSFQHCGRMHRTELPQLILRETPFQHWRCNTIQWYCTGVACWIYWVQYNASRMEASISGGNQTLLCRLGSYPRVSWESKGEPSTDISKVTTCPSPSYGKSWCSILPIHPTNTSSDTSSDFLCFLSAVPAQAVKQSFSPRHLLMAHRCVRKSASPMRTGTKPPPTTPSAVPSLASGADSSSSEKPEQDTHPNPPAVQTPAAPTTTFKGACPSFLLFLLNLTEAELDCCFISLPSPHWVCLY